MKTARYTLLISIAGYIYPDPVADALHVNSKAYALYTVSKEQEQAERVGAGYTPPAALLWHGQLDDTTDQYPDYVLEHGPRGGAYWRRA